MGLAVGGATEHRQQHAGLASFALLCGCAWPCKKVELEWRGEVLNEACGECVKSWNEVGSEVKVKRTKWNVRCDARKRKEMRQEC